MYTLHSEGQKLSYQSRKAFEDRKETKGKHFKDSSDLTLIKNYSKGDFQSFLYSIPNCHAESMNSSELASYVIQDLLCVTTLFFRQTTQNSPKYGFPNKRLHSLIQNHIVTSSDDFSSHLILQVKTISKHSKVMPLPKTICTKQFAEYEKG